MLSLIDEQPIEPGYGRIYQSGVIASEDWEDGLIVSMSGNENYRPPCLWIDIPDNNIYVLPERTLICMCAASEDFLSHGFDVLIHCNEGKYRSTYMDVALHMYIGMSFDEALTLVSQRHPIARLREGTLSQLRGWKR